MNNFIEGNNRSYDFIAPLGAGIFYTQKTTITLAFLGLLIYCE